MKSSEFRGATKVFRFTLAQTLKSKAYVITTIILIVASVAVIPIMQMIQDGGKGEEDEVVGEVFKEEDSDEALEDVTLHIYDHSEQILGAAFTDMGFDWECIKEDAKNTGVTIVIEKGELQDGLDAIEASEKKELAVELGLSEKGMGLGVNVYHDTKGHVSEEIAGNVADYYAGKLTEFKNAIAELTEEQQKIVDAKISVIMNFTNADGAVEEEKDTTISDMQYGICYACIFIVLMVVIIASTQVATSITTDKSTKVVEYLLTSIRPMALVVGKVCAMLLLSVGQLVVMMTLVLLSNKLFSTGNLTVLENFFSPEIWKNMSALNLILALVAIVLGFLFYGMLAALCGATVSKMEALQEALSLFTFTAMVGAYVGIGAMTVMLASGDSPIVIVAELLPLSTGFFLPGALLIGKASIVIAIAGIALLFVTDVIFFRFVAKVYELVINHNGERIKPKELISMYRGIKKGGKTV